MRERFFSFKIFGKWWFVKIEWWKERDTTKETLMLDEGVPYSNRHEFKK